MKTITTIMTFIFFFSGFALCQADNIDEGFKGLSVNTAKSQIKQDLTPVDTAELWVPVQNTMFVNTTTTVSIDKSLQYFGLDVARIEIQFQDSYGDEAGQDIYQFTVFLERPSEEAYDDFLQMVMDTYGPVLTYSINMEKGTESPNWFTDKTLMTVSSYDDFIVHNKKKYLMVTYMQAYGG